MNDRALKVVVGCAHLVLGFAFFMFMFWLGEQWRDTLQASPPPPPAWNPSYITGCKMQLWFDVTSGIDEDALETTSQELTCWYPRRGWEPATR